MSAAVSVPAAYGRSTVPYLAQYASRNAGEIMAAYCQRQQKSHFWITSVPQWRKGGEGSDVMAIAGVGFVIKHPGLYFTGPAHHGFQAGDQLMYAGQPITHIEMLERSAGGRLLHRYAPMREFVLARSREIFIPKEYLGPDGDQPTLYRAVGDKNVAELLINPLAAMSRGARPHAQPSLTKEEDAVLRTIKAYLGAPGSAAAPQPHSPLRNV